MTIRRNKNWKDGGWMGQPEFKYDCNWQCDGLANIEGPRQDTKTLKPVATYNIDMVRNTQNIAMSCMTIR